jgi:prepilin-type N-terminal cleavage/methylation domain-containing protein
MTPAVNGARRRGAGEDGFTLVELLVVAFIIGLLAALGISSFLGQRSKAQDADAKQTLRTAAHAIQIFHMDHDTFDARVSDLTAIEPSLGAARNLVVNGTAGTFDLSVDSASGLNAFSLARRADGSVVRSCLNPGQGGCHEAPDATGSLW